MEKIETSVVHLQVHEITDEHIRQINVLSNLIRREVLSDDPPIPLEEELQNFHTIPEFFDPEFWVISSPDNTSLVALGQGTIYHTGDNEHMLEFYIQVAPQVRRCGYAKQLLRKLVEFGRAKNRRLLMTSTNDRIPAGAVLMEKLGAKRGLEMHTNQLRMPELNRSLIQLWSEKYASLENDFEVVFVNGAYPEDDLINLVELFQEVINDQPRDALEMEDTNFTPKIMRQMEKNTFATGTTRWTIYLHERASGRIAGLTEVYFNPHRPHILNQGFTGVQPAFRNKGLGHWLKALMMNKILQDRPQTEFIRTGNANSNGPMLKINHELGFKPYIARTIWQVGIDKVEAYLAH